MQKTATQLYYRSVAFRLLEYIDAHLQYDITPDLLSDHVYVSKDHLAVIFSQMQQESVGKYIKRARLERAAALMTYTRRSLSQVAEQVGYSGKHALSKSFQQYFGNSPGRYRKRLCYLKDSPNVIMDGIGSEEEYIDLINENFAFSYRIEELHDHYTLCRPLRMVPALLQRNFSYDDYLQEAGKDFADTGIGARFVVRPYDSVNFTAAADFNMHHGLLLHKSKLAQLPEAMRRENLLCAVKSGKYLVLDIPAGEADAQIKKYTTLFRENLIGRQRAFDIEDFCTFLLPGDNQDCAGQFYIFLKE